MYSFHTKKKKKETYFLCWNFYSHFYHFYHFQNKKPQAELLLPRASHAEKTIAIGVSPRFHVGESQHCRVEVCKGIFR